MRCRTDMYDIVPHQDAVSARVEASSPLTPRSASFTFPLQHQPVSVIDGERDVLDEARWHAALRDSTHRLNDCEWNITCGVACLYTMSCD